MSFLDEFKKLTRAYDEDDDEFIDEAESAPQPPRQAQPQQQQPQAERPRSNPFSNFTSESASSSRQSRAAAGRGEGRVVSLSGNSQTQVVLVKPERFETAAEIADHLRNQRAVLMNMESAPKEVTRRLVDFLSGVTYALDGNIRKVAASTYMLTPPNVNLVSEQMGDLQASGIHF